MTLPTTVLLAALLSPQAPEPPLAFDAASIRHAAAQIPVTIKTDPGRLSANSVSLTDLIQQAYSVSRLQISGEPSNLGRFDIAATAEGSHTRAELMEMLQALLADRFELSFHRETREMTIQALVLAKGEQKLRPAAKDGDPKIGLRGSHANEKPGSVYVNGESAPISFLANYIAPHIGEIVIDQTGLTGAFDFDINFEMDQERVADPNIPEREIAKEMMEDAVRSLGLKLEQRRAAVEFIVIDHAGQPSGN